MATSAQVTLNTSTPSLLAECTTSPPINVLLQSPGSGSETFLGDSSVTAATGYLLGQVANPLQPIKLLPGDSLYGIASANNPVVHVLTWEADC